MGEKKSDGQIRSEIQAMSNEVSSLLSSNNASRAIGVAIRDPPFETKDSSLKDEAYDVVSRVLEAISEAQIKDIVTGLELEDCDVLMKYVYREMDNQRNCSAMLKWHAFLVDRAGIGSVVRAMTDRKTV